VSSSSCGRRTTHLVSLINFRSVVDIAQHTSRKSNHHNGNPPFLFFFFSSCFHSPLIHQDTTNVSTPPTLFFHRHLISCSLPFTSLLFQYRRLPSTLSPSLSSVAPTVQHLPPSSLRLKSSYSPILLSSHHHHLIQSDMW
jgi:hypothetical protein